MKLEGKEESRIGAASLRDLLHRYFPILGWGLNIPARRSQTT
jgi:hypothetical protein